MKRMTPLALVVGVLGILCSSGGEAAEKWGPFRGQIVDVETGQPIAGAVVLVVWYEAVPTPVQTNQKFFDAREVVTGPDGRFEVPRRSPPFFAFRIFDPHVIYFAPGYGPDKEVVTPPGGQIFVDPTVVFLRPLKTREALLKKSRSWPVEVPLEKMTEFMKAINRESEMLGLGSIPIVPEGGRKP